MVENNGQNDFSRDDFKFADHGGFYMLLKNCIIFNQEIESPSITVYGDDYFYKGNLKKLNEYIKWLGNCKNELIKYYCEYFIKKFNKSGKITIEEIIKENWYEKLIVNDVEIEIDEDGNLSSEISCYKRWDEGEEKKIDPGCYYSSIEIKTENYIISSIDIWD
jgi:hypothetical protein